MNIGFVANESKKKLMQNFCIAYRAILAKHELFATGTTGRLIEDCLLYTSPSPRDRTRSRMPSSA